MKTKRVDYGDCQNFRFDYQGNKTGCMCILGKRIAFRQKSHPDLADYESGWPRYCNDFKTDK